MIALLGMGVAHAIPLDRHQRFCLAVDVSFNDDPGGDRWTDDTIDKPARGFLVEVREILVGSSVVVWSGHTGEGGTDVGCTPWVTLTHDPADPNTPRYLVRVYSSDALVRGNLLHSYLDPLVEDEAVVDVMSNHVPLVDWQTLYPPSLPGNTDKRWNVLATAAFALYLHDGGIDGEYTFGVSTGASYDATQNVVWLDDRKRWVYVHELGHALTELLAGDAGFNKDYGAATDNCGDTDPVSHRLLEKEWQSAAGVEGIANWFAQITFNEVYAGADCSWAYWRSIDWDNSGSQDRAAGDESLCFGDPDGPITSGGTWADDTDWLQHAVDEPDLLGCTDANLNPAGPLRSRGSEYDWARFLWSLTTVHGNTVQQVWDLWVDADPATWDPNEGTASTADDPVIRMAVGGGSISGYSSAAATHGLDH